MSALVDKFNQRPYLFTTLFFTALSCLFFLPVVFQGKLLAPGDALVQYLPAFQGANQIWTTQILCGFPWYADPQSQIFYPLKQILSPIPGGWNLYMMSAFAMAGIFAAFYAFSLTGCWTAALIGGCIYGFNGFLLSNFRHTTMVHSAVWLPLALWAIRRSRLDLEEGKHSSARWFAVTVTATSLLCLAGHPQMFCYGLALLGGYVIAETFEAGSKYRLRVALFNLLALALGVGIAAVSIIPAAELASFSWRWGMTYKLFVEYALVPVNLILLIFPFAFGAFKESMYGCNFFGAYDLQTVSGYFGLMSFLLVPIGAFAFRKEKVIVFWTIALTLLFILMFGDVGFLSQAAYQLPCYNRFRVPTRHFMEIGMAVSCLCAAGVAALSAGKVSQKTALRAHITFLGFFALTAFIACTIAGMSQERVRETSAGVFGAMPWNNAALAIPILLFVIGSAVFIACVKLPHLRWHALIAIFVLDFAAYAAGSEYIVHSPSNSAVLPPEHAAWLNAEAAKTHQRVISVRGNSGSKDELPVNLSMLWGVENACGYENLLPQRISKLLDMKEGGFLVGSWASEENRSLDILAVKYVVIPKNDSRYPAPQGSRWKLFKEAGDALIYENCRAMPRVWLANRLRVFPNNGPAEELAKAVQTGCIANSPVDFASTAMFDSATETDKTNFDFAKDPDASAVISELKENSMTVQVKSNEPVVLVTADSFYPGWQVSIDGKQDPTLRLMQVDYAIRAVRLPKGEHTVRFEFAPEKLKLGLTISIASLLAAVCAGLFLHRRRMSPYLAVVDNP